MWSMVADLEVTPLQQAVGILSDYMASETQSYSQKNKQTNR